MKRPRKPKKRVCKKQWMKEWWEREEEDDEREFPKWMTHYCSDHQILLVGDGDFSFSLSLAKAFASASNIVATSLDTYDEVIKKYKNAKSNLEDLQKLGAYLLHGVDATKMKFHPDLQMRRFDRIIFNFPHAGFYGKEDNLMMIKMHMDLVFGFFKNATHMLRENGEVHVNHKTTPPFDTWKIEKLAEQSFLMMIECVDFKQEDYPGYNNKRGHRSRCDDPFPLGKCSTFKFIYNPRSMKDHLRRNHMEASRQQMTTNISFQEIQNMDRFPAPVGLNYHPRTRLPFEEIQNMERFPDPIDSNYLPQTRLPFEEIHNMERFPAPVDYSYHPRTRLPFEEIHNMELTRLPLEVIHNVERIPAPVVLNYHPRTSLVQKPNQLDYYPLTSRFPKTDQLDHYPQTSIFPKADQLNHYPQRVASSADYYRYARDMTQDTQRLLQPTESSYNQSSQQWPTPTNCRLGLTEHHRRTMDVAPSMPLGARNDGFERSSTYLQEELNRNAQRSSDCYDIARHELERYNAEVSRRNLCYAMNM
ncbi:uncharacterized protein LOC131656483 [Vicia villosa]|uniref:uncharacterized protein LOC131656483 n=1 Tax=Vicia villosa TaxID=3911 RepID=UPI00273CBA23|nr:uncharacterized protein LOC131656483 [Vicia villosa]